MKNMTNTIILVACVIAAYAVFYLVLGAEGNFTDPKTQVVLPHLKPGDKDWTSHGT